jgi:hypothetical protein
MRKLFAILLLSVLPARGAPAQQGLPYAWPRTIGTSASAVLPFNPTRKQLFFVNPNAVAIIAVCPAVDRVTGGAIACTLHGPGAIPILPYAYLPLAGVGGNPNLPQAWNAISDTAASALTILEWE